MLPTFWIKQQVRYSGFKKVIGMRVFIYRYVTQRIYNINMKPSQELTNFSLKIKSTFCQYIFSVILLKFSEPR